MRFNKPLILPVLFNTDEVTELKKVGVEYEGDYDSLNIRKCPFYSIGVILPEQQEENYSTLITEGETFIIRMPIKQLVKKVEEHANNIQGD